MDTRKLIELLRATIDPNQRQQAEEQLSQVRLNMCLACSMLSPAGGWRKYTITILKTILLLVIMCNFYRRYIK